MGFSSGSGTGSISTGSDVALNTPATGQGLIYDASVSKWKNQAVYSKPVGGIPVSDLTSDTQAKLNATSSVLVLEAAQAIPVNTPEGTLIFRKSS